MTANTLVLNSNYLPLNICDTRRAVRLLALGKADVLESWEDRTIKGASSEIVVPAVLRLKYLVKRPYRDTPLTRKNIYDRDGHRCCYCGSADRLTIDHVVPLSKGGRHEWTNVVTCCYSCNNKKGDKINEEAGLKLPAPPRKPYAGLPMNQVQSHSSWADYLPGGTAYG